jgi:hypothetical protein
MPTSCLTDRDGSGHGERCIVHIVIIIADSPRNVSRCYEFYANPHFGQALMCGAERRFMIAAQGPVKISHGRSESAEAWHLPSI